MSLVTHYLAALAVPKLGLVRLTRLVDAFGGLEAALAAPAKLLELVEGVPTSVARSFPREVARLLPLAAMQLREAQAAGLTVLACTDEAYPQSLLDDPAGGTPVLFIAGELPPGVLRRAHESLGCAVVGTRRASDFSLGFASDLGRSLAHAGAVVVSGLALGVDGAAHLGALEAVRGPRVGAAAATGSTVAVLGGGHDRLYPASHQRLAERIVAEGGAVISEWPLGVSPQPHHFLQRNRVISGLSRVVAVIEAGSRSGAINTARHALEQGRSVLVVPSRPGDSRFAGSLSLLSDGAQLLLEARDVLSHYGELTRAKPDVNAAPSELSLFGPQATAGVGESGMSAPESRSVTLLKQLLAGAAESSLDSLLPRLDLSLSELIGLITELELRGEVSVTSSGRYRLRSAPR